jgi:hypothetical protein
VAVCCYNDAHDFFDEWSGDSLPENAVDRMLHDQKTFPDLLRIHSVESGSFLSGKDFNAANVAIAQFGRSGVHTAEAFFHNLPDERAQKVVTVTSKPGADVITTEINERGFEVSAVNLWRPSTMKPNMQATNPTDVEPWLDLVDKLFGKDTPEAKHFLDFCASVLRRPGQKIGHALVLVGGQGVGKDTVLKPIFEALGVHNLAAIGPEELFGQFNPFLLKQVVYVQEMMTYGRRDLANKVKPYISGQTTRLTINEKGIRQYSVPNNQNWFITSNFDNAIALEDDDRRFWVHKSLIEEAPSREYFGRLYEWFSTGGVAKVFGWLMQRDISNFDPMARPPMTAAKRAMLDASLPAPLQWLCGQLAPEGNFASRTVITVAELLNDFGAPGGVNPKYAATALKRAGFKPVARVKINGDARQLWVRDASGALAALSADELRERYLAEVTRGGGGDGEDG